MDRKEKARKVLDILSREFPDAKTALDHSTPFELLIATILSAQATDKLVNKVTVKLFKRFKGPKDFASAPLQEIEGAISSVNFFRNKARNIKGASEKIVMDFDGRVPESVEELVSLPGVGRKTANIVIGNAFGRPALAVDTHVKRVAQRLGLTDSDGPDEVEEDLTSVIPEKMWSRTTNLFIAHGRKTCKARNPDCEACPVNRHCEYYKKEFAAARKVR